jgi:hypothetical protein
VRFGNKIAKLPKKSESIPVGGYGPGYYTIGAVWQNPIYVARNVEGYKAGLRSIVQAGAAWIHIETWNELHEGTDIAWSQEYGFSFIDATREVADYFHSITGYQPLLGIEVPFMIMMVMTIIMLTAIVFIVQTKNKIV